MYDMPVSAMGTLYYGFHELIEKGSYQVGPFSVLRKMLLVTRKMLPSRSRIVIENLVFAPLLGIFLVEYAIKMVNDHRVNMSLLLLL
nr:hypothetical protein [Tanacetum cinerariifolium]